MTSKTKPYNLPDKNGKFGKFGGRYVAETLMPAIFAQFDLNILRYS